VVAAHGRRGDEDGYDGQQETGRCVRTHDFDIIIKCYLCNGGWIQVDWSKNHNYNIITVFNVFGIIVNF